MIKLDAGEGGSFIATLCSFYTWSCRLSLVEETDWVFIPFDVIDVMQLSKVPGAILKLSFAPASPKLPPSLSSFSLSAECVWLVLLDGREPSKGQHSVCGANAAGGAACYGSIVDGEGHGNNLLVCYT